MVSTAPSTEPCGTPLMDRTHVLEPQQENTQQILNFNSVFFLLQERRKERERRGKEEEEMRMRREEDVKRRREEEVKRRREVVARICKQPKMISTTTSEEDESKGGRAYRSRKFLNLFAKGSSQYSTAGRYQTGSITLARRKHLENT